MWDHNLFLGEGRNRHFTDGRDSILLFYRLSDLLTDGMEVAGSVLSLRRSRWTLFEISECILNEEILISLKAYLGLHSIRCEIVNHRHLGILTDQCKDLNLLLVEETHEVRWTTFGRQENKKKTRLIRIYISGFKIFFVFYIVN